MTRTLKGLSLAAGVVLGCAASQAQVSCPVFSGGGTLHADGTILLVGQVAIGPVAGADKLDQGAVPCWLVPGGCTGDLDGDADTDIDDLLAVLADFGNPGPGGAGDADGDGDTDMDDLLIVLAFFNGSCA